MVIHTMGEYGGAINIIDAMHQQPMMLPHEQMSNNDRVPNERMSFADYNKSMYTPKETGVVLPAIELRLNKKKG
jgi:hypothetical protein